jgi:hypothetical protein
MTDQAGMTAEEYRAEHGTRLWSEVFGTDDPNPFTTTPKRGRRRRSSAEQIARRVERTTAKPERPAPTTSAEKIAARAGYWGQDEGS